MAQELISKEVDGMSDEQFLTKMKLLIGGKVTNAAMLCWKILILTICSQPLQVLCDVSMVRTEHY